MKDTHFFLPPAKRDRLAAVYGSDANGKAVRSADGARGQGHYVDGPRKSFSGGAGLVSTARDYATLPRGAAQRRRARQGAHPLAARRAAHDHQPDRRPQDARAAWASASASRPPTNTASAGMESVGSWGWGGAYGTYYRVDPAERLVTVLMIQLMPNSTDLTDKFKASIYQALLD